MMDYFHYTNFKVHISLCNLIVWNEVLGFYLKKNQLHHNLSDNLMNDSFFKISALTEFLDISIEKILKNMSELGCMNFK